MNKKQLAVLGACLEHGKNFWELRGVRAAPDGLRNQDGSVPTQVIVQHILKSLQDIEAVLEVKTGAFRCKECGLMIWDRNALLIGPDRYCMECGTLMVETLAVDGGLEQHLIEDLARQSLCGTHATGLYEAWEHEHPFLGYWLRILETDPRIGVAWSGLRRLMSA